MGGYEEFMRKEVYDMAIKTGSRAINNVNIDKTTVSNMLELFQGDPNEACLTLMVYIKRQESRNEIKDKKLAASLIHDLYAIYKRFNDKSDILEKAVRKYLTLFKWVFESNIRNVDNIDKFVEKIISR